MIDNATMGFSADQWMLKSIYCFVIRQSIFLAFGTQIIVYGTTCPVNISLS